MKQSTKKLGGVIKHILEGLAGIFVARKTITNRAPMPEIVTQADRLVEQKTETKLYENQNKGFLTCPIQAQDNSGLPVNPYTVKISAVLDHSGTAIDPSSNKHWGKSAKDQKVKAFNGEVGEGVQCSQEPCGYSNTDGEDFFQKREINYVGVSYDGGKSVLQYDGHAGYDFSYPKGTPVVAPADGKLYKATPGKDLIYGANWNTDGSFYIEHENGYVTWFRHCEKLSDILEAQISSDFTQSCRVSAGDVIAYVGNKGTRPVHLHFEVRDQEGKIVDPYNDRLWRNSV